MKIDSNGKIEWTPIDNQIGTKHTTVKVDEGKFGIATQSFDIAIDPTVTKGSLLVGLGYSARPIPV
jgi:hypothetical protein